MNFLNRLAIEDYDKFSISRQYMILSDFDPKDLVSHIEQGKPLKVLIPEAILPFLQKDPRVSLNPEDVIAASGEWGRICGVRFSCYSKQMVNKEYKILIYRDKPRNGSSVKILLP